MRRPHQTRGTVIGVPRNVNWKFSNKNIKHNFRSEQTIEFRDVSDLSQILHSYSVAPHKPDRLYAVTPHTLLYADASKRPRDVHWLDLSGSKPKPAAGKRAIHLEQDDIRNMCFVQHGDKQLLIVADRNKLFAYNTNTGKNEWKVSGKLQGVDKGIDFSGVTTDACGNLFVCDFKNGNNCIHLFRASDGQHLGCLMKDDEELGHPGIVHWYDKTSSLITACVFKEKWHITVISVQF